MSGLPALAQATGPADVQAIGVSITSLIGSLGAAGAAVAVTYYFLAFLRSETEKQNHVLEEFRQYHADTQMKFQDQLDRITDRQQHLQQAYQEQISRMAEAQATLLHDAVLVMRSVEKSLESSTTTIHGMERTVSALRASIRSIDLILHRVAKERGEAHQPAPPAKESRREPS
jgi:flagellar hook-basal body complex protein FliE